MTQAEFKKKMKVWGEDFYENTCYSLQAEIVRKIMNCKEIGDFDKITILNQYINNLVTNDVVYETINRIKKELK